MDIRISHSITAINWLGLINFNFGFVEEEEAENRPYVRADNEYWNYGAEITFSNIIFTNCPHNLWGNVRCRLATEEEARQLRNQHHFSETATVYCFIAGVVEYIRETTDKETGEVVPGHRLPPEEYFLAADSVKIVVFKTDSDIPVDWSDLWEKGNFFDLTERWQKSLLRGSQTKKVAKKAAREAEKAHTQLPSSNVENQELE